MLSPLLLTTLGPEATGVFGAGFVLDPLLDKSFALFDFLQIHKRTDKPTIHQELGLRRTQLRRALCGHRQFRQSFWRCCTLPFATTKEALHLEDVLHGLEFGAQIFRLLRVLLEELVREALLGDQHWFKCKSFGFGVANLIPEFCSKQSTPGKIRDTKHPVGGSTHRLPLRVLHRAFTPEGFSAYG